MSALSLAPNAAQFGCSNHPQTAKAQFGKAASHQCQFSGCCAQFGADTSKASVCDSSGGDCSSGPGVVGVLGAVALVIASLFVGKRVIGTVFGTASTGIRDFCSRLFTGKGLVEKAKILSKNALDTAQANGYIQGASHGLVAGWNKALAYVRRLIS